MRVRSAPDAEVVRRVTPSLLEVAYAEHTLDRFPGVLRSAFRWFACLPLSQSSTPMPEPAWPAPCYVNAAPRVDALLSQIRGLDAQRLGSPSACVRNQRNPIEQLVQATPVCVVWSKPWSGDLAEVMLYHTRSASADYVTVGYFAYWSTERPFGDNSLTRWILPAVAIDAVYSHLLFVFPGIQKLMYGPGDVEGIRVTYRVVNSERLVPIAAIADDASHRELSLPLNELVDDRGRIMVLTEWWSHQLGGKGAASAAKSGASLRCFEQAGLQPVTANVANEFRLGTVEAPNRATPAWRLADWEPS